MKTLNRLWWKIDCQDRVLGRVATRAATLLMGKHKPEFESHLDSGDHVVLVNAKQIVLTGNKLADKIYYRHSGYRGGFKQQSLASLRRQGKDTWILKHAVLGMLPKNTLAKSMAKRLHIYDEQPGKLEVKLVEDNYGQK